MSDKSFYEQVYDLVRQIPRGRVTSYGRVAQMLGRPNAARAVGYALSALKDEQTTVAKDVPWHRVINSQGRITISNREHSAEDQALLLRAEGIMVGDDMRVDLDHYLWRGLHWLEIDDILGEN